MLSCYIVTHCNKEQTFYYNFSVNFRNYHCVQLEGHEIICVWKIKRLKYRELKTALTDFVNEVNKLP